MKYLWLCLFLVLWPRLSLGAVAVDSTITATANGTTSISTSHTVSGTNRLILALVASYSSSVTACDWNGAALTKADESISSGGITVAIWSLIAPATGSHTMTCNLDQPYEKVLGVVSLTGVHQSVPLGTPVKDNGSSFVHNYVDVTGAANGLIIDALALDTDTPTPTQTSLLSATISFLGLSSSTATGTGTITMGWDWGSGNYNAHIGVLVNPAAATTVRRHGPIIQ